MENVLAGPRGKASLEEKLSISKCWFSVQRVWHSRVQVLDGQKGKFEKKTQFFSKIWFADRILRSLQQCCGQDNLTKG